jgi:hypothetical protein
MARREDPARDGEVDRVERRGDHVDRLAFRRVGIARFGQGTDLSDQGGSHEPEPNGSGWGGHKFRCGDAAFWSHPKPPFTSGGQLANTLGREGLDVEPIDRLRRREITQADAEGNGRARARRPAT